MRLVKKKVELTFAYAMLDFMVMVLIARVCIILTYYLPVIAFGGV